MESHIKIDGVELRVELYYSRIDGELDEMYVFIGDDEISNLLSEQKLDEIQYEAEESVR